MPTTVPASTTPRATVHSASTFLYKKDVLTKPLCPIKGLSNNNEGNCWKKLKSRNLGDHPDCTIPIYTT